MTCLSKLRAALRRPVMLVACAVFLLVLWTPIMVALLGLRPAAPIKEKRKPAALPAMPTTMDTAAKFPAAFSAYYSDNFGLRDLLIRTQGWWKFYLFNTGNDIDQHTGVVVGKDAWLFGGGLTMDTVRRKKSFDDAQLDEIVSFFTSRSDWAAARGIPFLVAFVPTSGQVYPEYLPDWLYPIQETSRLDQLMPQLAGVPGIQCISLWDALCAGKKTTQVYYRTDGHWNGAGAHYGAAELARKTCEMLAMKERGAAGAPKILQESGRAWSFAEFLAIDTVLKEDKVEVGYADRIKRTAMDDKNKGVTLFENPKRADAPSVFVFHDSFGGYGFDKSFPQHFSRTWFAHYLESRFDMRLVQQFKPDAVVVLLSESRLQDYWKFNLPLLQPAVKTFRSLPWRVEMSSSGNSDLVAGDGWASPEKDGCWTSPHTPANRSSLVFPKPGGPLSLTVSCCGAAEMADSPQQVQVCANGVQVAEWNLGKEKATYRAEIPKADAGKAELLTISFVLAAPPGPSGTKIKRGMKLSAIVLDALK